MHAQRPCGRKSVRWVDNDSDAQPLRTTDTHTVAPGSIIFSTLASFSEAKLPMMIRRRICHLEEHARSWTSDQRAEYKVLCEEVGHDSTTLCSDSEDDNLSQTDSGEGPDPKELSRTRPSGIPRPVANSSIDLPARPRQAAHSPPDSPAAPMPDLGSLDDPDIF